MGPWWLYVLVFIFGYLTHKTFYFFRSIKISISLIKVSQIISLSLLAKTMEDFYYSHTLRLRQMRENEASPKDIKDVRRSFTVEISNYKERSIQHLIDLHPAFYNSLIHFDNWKSAMAYLEENRAIALDFIQQDKNDKKTSG